MNLVRHQSISNGRSKNKKMSNGMKKSWKSKKFWLILALIGIGLFIFELSENISKDIFPPGDNNNSIENRDGQKPVSVVYLNSQKQVSDEGETWQNSDFTRYIYDIALGDFELNKCYYFFYDNITKKITKGGQRKCNSNLAVTVGENQSCPSQGEKACTLYVYAIDRAGYQGETTPVVYHIDWQVPEIGKIYTKENETYPIKTEKGKIENYQVKVSDNTIVGYCQFYLDGENLGKMEIEPFPCRENIQCIASLNYALDGEESQMGFVRCADHYTSEKGGYLNIASSEAAEIVISLNHSPEISFCKVNPTQGNIQTEFKFEVEAVDPDGDNLSYNWDFGDGETSNEMNPFHYYLSPDTYMPEITVSDEEGKEVKCSTAWVVVSE